MPTMILAWAWLLASTIPCTRPCPAPAPSPAFASSLAASTNFPGWLGREVGTDQEQPGWLLFESDNDEETDDDNDDQGVATPRAAWPAPGTPFGEVASNPHPTILPRSALRSPVLRC